MKVISSFSTRLIYLLFSVLTVTKKLSKIKIYYSMVAFFLTSSSVYSLLLKRTLPCYLNSSRNLHFVLNYSTINYVLFEYKADDKYDAVLLRKLLASQFSYTFPRNKVHTVY